MFYLIPILLGAILYKFDVHTITKNYVTEKYTKFLSLNKLVSTQQKTKLMIIWVSLCIIAKMTWLNVIQWANNSIKEKDRKTIILTYVINGKQYKLVIKKPRGPQKILLIYDENNEDRTDEILPFLGPQYNCHNYKLTPKYFKCKTLTFELSSGIRRIFEENTVLNIL